jgi:CRISPR-associated endoribonuclease Cas6
LNKYKTGGDFLRIRFYFQIPSKFPIKHRLGILSYLKEAIHSQSNHFYESFFVENKQQTKPYVFATYFQHIKVKNGVIHAEGLKVTVSSSDTEFIILLINGCQQLKEFTYKDLNMSLIRMELLKEKTIVQSQVWFKTLSPMLIESKDGKPLLFGQPEFEKELNFIVSNKVQVIEGRRLYQPLKIIKGNTRKMVIKENFHQQEDSNLYFTANQGQFLLEGDQRDLTFFYQNGMGLRTGVGFGAIDII